MRFCLLLLTFASFATAATPTLVKTTVGDGPGHDALSAVAPAGDGAVAVGRRAAVAGEPTILGETADGWTYDHGTVIRVDGAGAVIAKAYFAKGLFLPTAVGASEDAVYVGGYAAPPMATLIADLGGLQREAGWAQRDWKTWCPPEHHSEPLRQDATDQRGVPCVLRFSADLAQLTGGTFLEGWQSAWHIPQPLREDTFQPLHLAIAADGDVIVSHDGGYCLPPEDGEQPSFEHFYAVGDHLSRLSPDLRERRWLTTFHTPLTDGAKVLKYQDNSGHFTMKWGSPKIEKWEHGFLGQPRVLRMRLDAEDRVYVGGWSPTRTSAEPWWSPFCLRFDPKTGERDTDWVVYTPDPMGGEGDRMGHLVSDACVRSIALTEDDRLLVSLTGDGGNNVLTRDPVDYTRPAAIHGRIGPFSGRHLFWGGWTKINPANRALVTGHYVGRAVERRWLRKSKALQQDMWIVDLSDTPARGVCAVGRFKQGLATSEDAWHPGTDPETGADLPVGGFLQLYGEDGQRRFSTAIPGFRPHELRRAGRRLWIAGERSLAQDAGTAAVLLAVDLPEEPVPPEPAP